MTGAQIEAWIEAASDRLEALRGPFDHWGQSAPMAVQFCDGHGLHRGDLQELRRAFFEARDRLLSRRFGESGPVLGIPARQVFVELFAIIANAERVGGEDR